MRRGSERGDSDKIYSAIRTAKGTHARSSMIFQRLNHSREASDETHDEIYG